MNKGKIFVKVCIICNRFFNIYPYEENSAKFCSHKCYWKSLIGKLSPIKGRVGYSSSLKGRKFPQRCGKNNPYWKPRIKIVCKTCQKEFYSLLSHHRKYCSGSCRTKHINLGSFKKGHTDLVSSEARKRAGEATTRTTKGKPAWYQVRNVQHPSWKGGLSREPYAFDFDEKLKNLIRERDQYKCQLCGVPQEECISKLSIHHIDYDKKNSNPNNLTTLCRSCNAKANGRREHWTNYFQKKLVKK